MEARFQAAQIVKTKGFYTRYESITKQEYRSAIDEDIPTYILIERGVYSDFETYLRNKENVTVNYPHVDSINICKLVEEIVSLPRNNPIYQFDRYEELQVWLRDQWAGLFRELINRMSSQRQLSSLAAQIGNLSEINSTLKTYLEKLMSKVAPDEAGPLIKKETERLDVASSISLISNSIFCQHLEDRYSIKPEQIRDPLLRASTTEEFFELLIGDTGNEELQSCWEHLFRDRITEDLNKIRKALSLPLLIFDTKSPSLGCRK